MYVLIARAAGRPVRQPHSPPAHLFLVFLAGDGSQNGNLIGLRLKDRKGYDFPFVSKVVMTSPASGMLNVGDLVTSVNGTSLKGEPHELGHELVRKVKIGGEVVFGLMGPPNNPPATPVQVNAKLVVPSPEKASAAAAPATKTGTASGGKKVAALFGSEEDDDNDDDGIPAAGPTKKPPAAVVKKAEAKPVKGIFDDVPEPEPELEVAEEKGADVKTEDSKKKKKSEGLFAALSDDEDQDEDEEIALMAPIAAATSSKRSGGKKKKGSLFAADEEEAAGVDNLEDLLGDDDNDDLDALMAAKPQKKGPESPGKAKKKRSLFDDDDDSAPAAGSVDVGDLGSLEEYINSNQ